MTKKIVGMPRNKGLADRFLLACAGRTQAEVSALTGVKINAIGRVQVGHSQVGKRTLMALAIGLNVSPAWLSHGEGDMRPLPGQDGLRKGAGAADPDVSAAVAAVPVADAFEALGGSCIQLAHALRKEAKSGLDDATLSTIKSCLFPPLKKPPAEPSPQKSPDNDPPPALPPYSKA